MRKHSWLLWAIAGAIIPALIAFAPLSGLRASPPEPAALTASPAADQAAALRRIHDAQLAHTSEMLAYQRALLADLESIADLVPPEYRMLCVETARAKGLAPRTLAALGWVESRWDPTAQGSSGEQGIMQIMPETGAWIAQRLRVHEYDLADPATSVWFGATYLRALIQEHGSLDDALAAYNAGNQWRTRAPLAARSYVDRVRTAAEER